jgi:pimeloyl-ACP methyl ester carboxylesterase
MLFIASAALAQVPEPDDTLGITATIPYQGGYASGSAYVYLGADHTSIENPVVIIEGFDIDNSMGWDYLYEAMNQQGMIESLSTRGFDGVVLDFTDATDYVQRNAFVAVELIEEINSIIPPEATIAVVGASMGGLVGRYALAYMESQAIDHNVRTFISFDAPQRGANIPLGIQYWVLFFSIESDDAAAMLASLQTPAPRQMLAYYYTDPPASSPAADPLFDSLQADLAAVGGYPSLPRKVAVANGSGYMTGQAFSAGEQLILYEYSSFLVDIVGNVWAVPDGGEQVIFDGVIDRIWPLSDDYLQVSVSGTRPFDSAPGSTRASMAQMDSTQAPYGDIIALYDDHCFIPTISALDIDTEDLFYDIAGDVNLLAHTPFDTVYFPVENQEHIAITAESARWFIDEIERGVFSSVRGPLASMGGIVLRQNSPNPFATSTALKFSLAEAGHVKLDIYDVRGRNIVTLLDGFVGAGARQVTWNGRDAAGRPAAPGIYFCNLSAGGRSQSVKMMRIR